MKCIDFGNPVDPDEWMYIVVAKTSAGSLEGGYGLTPSGEPFAYPS